VNSPVHLRLTRAYAAVAAPAIVAFMDVRGTQHQPAPTPAPIAAWWLGRTAYRDAWDLQHRIVAARAEGLIGDQLLLVEHEPVLTLGRRSDPAHVLAGPAELSERGVELIRVERGGEVTSHGPGQLVAYPIVRLVDRGLLIRPLVRALESALTETCATFGVEAGPRDGYPGCWCGGGMRKIGAVGLRVEHGISYHGIALNISVSLSDFELIDACGLTGVVSTSIERELGRPSEPTTESVARAAAAFAPALARALGASWPEPPRAMDAAAARSDLEDLLARTAVHDAVATGAGS
jgi:lipoyl(octanoyl) transferase